jgi:hypothetical protein
MPEAAEQVALLLSNPGWLIPDRGEFAAHATRVLSEAPEGHGNESGWRRHRAQLEGPCEACSLAHHAGLVRRNRNRWSRTPEEIEAARRRYKGSALQQANHQRREAARLARQYLGNAALAQGVREAPADEGSFNGAI